MNLQDDGAQIDGGSAGNEDSMSGLFVSYNSSDSTDVDLYQSMPAVSYTHLTLPTIREV